MNMSYQARENGKPCLLSFLLNDRNLICLSLPTTCFLSLLYRDMDEQYDEGRFASTSMWSWLEPFVQMLRHPVILTALLAAVSVVYNMLQVWLGLFETQHVSHCCGVDITSLFLLIVNLIRMSPLGHCMPYPPSCRATTSSVSVCLGWVVWLSSLALS